MAMNVLYVLQQLAVKVKVDKVDPFYLYHPKSKLSIKDVTRLKCSSQEWTAWISGLSKVFFFISQHVRHFILPTNPCVNEICTV